MSPPASLTDLFAHIDNNQPYYVDKLREAVSIASVSSDANARPTVMQMCRWLANEMHRLGISVQNRDVGKHIIDGQELDIPPILLGSLGDDPNKKTVLVYGHYDVQPAMLADGWSSNPWTLTELDDGRLVGRGATDDKGPVLAWLYVVEAHRQLNLPLPVNLKFCFEGMEESGSEGLDDLIEQEASLFFKDVDCVCISDNYWLGNSKPCITYGLRGISYFTITVQGPGWDLHSGVFGGTTHEPMTDLVHLMSKLVKTDGTILIPGIMDSVASVTEQELEIYDRLDFDMKDLEQSLGAQTLVHAQDKTKTLMHRWRYPALSLHGIEGAFYASGSKTVIPAKVTGKFSIRSVPNMDPDDICEKVKMYLTAEFQKLNSKNTMLCECLSAGKPWVADLDHWNYSAGIKAVEQVYGVTPDMTREGGSIPVTLTFQTMLGKSVLLMPMGRSNDGAHSVNEKLDKSNYIQGIQLLAAYLHQIAEVSAKDSL